MAPDPTWNPLLEAALLRALRECYAVENHDRFARRLTAPIIALSDATTRFGQWVSHQRRLELSRQMVRTRPWPEVISVLQHEMAHQFVDEVLGVRDEVAHGETFRRVCKERSIDGAAVGAPVPAQNAELDRILERIRKLLALAASSEMHEAELAMERAHELMLRHNVDAARSSSSCVYEVAHLGDPTKRRNAVEGAIAGLLASMFFVKVIQIPVFNVALGKSGSVYEIAGTAPNIAMATHVWEFLLGTADRLWQTNRNDSRITSGRDRLVYQAGVIRGFHDKLQRQRKELAAQAKAVSVASQSVALVWKGDSALDDFYHRRHPRIVTRRRSVRSSAAHAAGKQAGEKVVLHRPVSGQNGGARKLLPG